MTFGFSLYAVPLLVAQVVYFGIGLENLESRKLLEGSKICHCQHQKRSASFSWFSGWLPQCKLSDYILS